MNASTLACTKCRALLMAEGLPASGEVRCPSCGTSLQVEIFPALSRLVTEGKAGEHVLVEGESSCFYHPQKKAVIPCDMCGRFLCALCDLELHGQHLCPTCLDSGVKKSRLNQFENKRVRHDRIALVLAVAPIVCFWPITFLTAPASIYVALRYWNSPGGLIVGSGKGRKVTSIVLACLQLIGWGVFVYFLVRQSPGVRHGATY